MSASDPLLTYHGMAKLAGVTLETVYSWKKRGLLPAPSTKQQSRRPVWRQSVLLRWLESTGRETAQQKQASGETVPPVMGNTDRTGVTQ